jgi:hypothetical protein
MQASRGPTAAYRTLSHGVSQWLEGYPGEGCITCKLRSVVTTPCGMRRIMFGYPAPTAKFNTGCVFATLHLHTPSSLCYSRTPAAAAAQLLACELACKLKLPSWLLYICFKQASRMVTGYYRGQPLQPTSLTGLCLAGTGNMAPTHALA